MGFKQGCGQENEGSFPEGERLILEFNVEGGGFRSGKSHAVGMATGRGNCRLRSEQS